jgi:hypothetical protein
MLQTVTVKVLGTSTTSGKTSFPRVPAVKFSPPPKAIGAPPLKGKIKKFPTVSTFVYLQYYFFNLIEKRKNFTKGTVVNGKCSVTKRKNKFYQLGLCV